MRLFGKCNKVQAERSERCSAYFDHVQSSSSLLQTIQYRQNTLNMSTSAKSTLDPVSFLFSQVLNQVDYLFERGYLTQNNYAAIAGALLQSSLPATPSEPASSSDYGTINAFTAEPRAYSMPTTASSSGAPPPPVQSHFESSGTILPSQQSPQSSKTSGRPSLLKFGNKSSKGKDTSVDRPLPQVPFAEADAPQLGRVNRRIRGALQGGYAST